MMNIEVNDFNKSLSINIENRYKRNVMLINRFVPFNRIKKFIRRSITNNTIIIISNNARNYHLFNSTEIFGIIIFDGYKLLYTDFINYKNALYIADDCNICCNKFDNTRRKCERCNYSICVKCQAILMIRDIPYFDLKCPQCSYISMTQFNGDIEQFINKFELRDVEVNGITKKDICDLFMLYYSSNDKYNLELQIEREAAVINNQYIFEIDQLNRFGGTLVPYSSSSSSSSGGSISNTDIDGESDNDDDDNNNNEIHNTDEGIEDDGIIDIDLFISQDKYGLNRDDLDRFNEDRF